MASDKVVLTIKNLIENITLDELKYHQMLESGKAKTKVMKSSLVRDAGTEILNENVLGKGDGT